MSRAFVKEDVDPPERSGRKRSESGLPPGATNYMSAAGAARLRAELARLRREQRGNDRAQEIEQILGAVTIVEPPNEQSTEPGFGARLTLREGTKQSRTARIVGVNELDLFKDAVSWVSPLGRVLLAAEKGGRVILPDGGMAEVVEVEYPSE